MFLQLANGGQTVDRVSGKSADRLGDDKVDSASEGISDHALEALTVLGVSTGYALVRIDRYQLPIVPAVDVVGIVVNLGGITGELFLAVGGNTGVGSHPAFFLFVNRCRCEPIQHSAGSGKSNSIVWLAHRLSGLHDYKDEKIFHSIIIVTDRRVLNSQLQNTVYQFDHVEGVVARIDKNSQQLKEAINAGIPIIITTLQKFPIIYKEVTSDNKRFAVIIDEAHSSQTGDSAKKLKRALADAEKILEEYADLEYEAEVNRKDDTDKLLEELAAQGLHGNMSFFAFTATPKRQNIANVRVERRRRTLLSVPHLFYATSH